MKNINTLNIKNKIGKWTVFACCLWIFGCNQSGSDNKNNPPPNTVYFQGMSQQVFTADMQDYSGRWVMRLNLLGQNNIQPLGSNNPIDYSGPISAVGKMNIDLGYSTLGCIIPAGPYTVQTIQAGVLNRSFVGALKLEALGPARVVMAISQAQFSAKYYEQMGYTYPEVGNKGRLFGDIIIESINGLPCQRSVLME